MPCEKEECKYGLAWANIEATVGYVRGILGDACPEGRIDLCLPQSAATSHGPSEETIG